MHERATPRDPGAEALADALQVSFRVLRYVMVLLLIGYLLSGLFVVKQQERAFVLIFGRIAGLGAERVKGPGVHWTLPRPFAEVKRVTTEQVLALETGSFWSAAPERPNLPGAPTGPTGPLVPGRDGYSVTGDANLLHSRWTVRYTIDNPEAYAFGFQDNGAVILSELDHAVVKASARFPIDQALRTDLAGFRAAVAAELRRRCEELGLGIKIEGLDVLTAPPRQVADAFNGVLAAEQERSEKVSAARGYATRALNEARGQAAKLQAEGEAYKLRLVSEVSADASYFDKVYEQYVKSPNVIARTLWQDTVRRTLAAVEQKYLIYRSTTGQQQLRILLSPPAPTLGAKETK